MPAIGLGLWERGLFLDKRKAIFYSEKQHKALQELVINHVPDITAAVIEINGSCKAKFPTTSRESQLEFAFSTASFVHRRAAALSPCSRARSSCKKGPPAGCKLYDMMEQTGAKM